tara:strand:- start:117 stop:1004 length:888 start_codon:yes stop_codon:yes gene_type:complete
MSNPKRALVLSAGGAKGAYQIGVLKKWLYEDEADYNILCGVSVGAINVLKLSLTEYGKPKESYKLLHSYWSNIDKGHIYKDWHPLGKMSALWKRSIYDCSPLHDLIKKDFDIKKIRNSNKQIKIGAVCLNDGEKYFATEKDNNLDDWCCASASVPILMKPMSINNKLWIDGGIKVLTPIEQALSMGATEIDIISCSGTANKLWTPTYNVLSLLNVAYRSYELMHERIMKADFHAIGLYNQFSIIERKKFDNVKIRIIRPQKTLYDKADILDFDNYQVRKMIEVGYDDACKYSKNI